MFTGLKIEINLENAAFSDGAACLETARILRKYADAVEEGCGMEDLEHRLRDINGNTVGDARLTE